MFVCFGRKSIVFRSIIIMERGVGDPTDCTTGRLVADGGLYLMGRFGCRENHVDGKAFNEAE